MSWFAECKTAVGRSLECRETWARHRLTFARQKRAAARHEFYRNGWRSRGLTEQFLETRGRLICILARRRLAQKFLETRGRRRLRSPAVLEVHRRWRGRPRGSIHLLIGWIVCSRLDRPCR